MGESAISSLCMQHSGWDQIHFMSTVLIQFSKQALPRTIRPSLKHSDLYYTFVVCQHFKKTYGFQPILHHFQLNILGEIFELENMLIPPCNLSLLQLPGARFKVIYIYVNAQFWDYLFLLNFSLIAQHYCTEQNLMYVRRTHSLINCIAFFNCQSSISCECFRRTN